MYKRQELLNMPRAMWAGIAAMSAILPFMEDMQYIVRKRIVGNIAGVICFTVLYFLLPSSIYTYIGILGGIGVGLSAKSVSYTHLPDRRWYWRGCSRHRRESSSEVLSFLRTA